MMGCIESARYSLENDLHVALHDIGRVVRLQTCMRKDHMINVHAIFARGCDILTSKKFLSHMDAQAEASRSAP